MLADRLRALGPDHPDTLTTRNKALLADQVRVLGNDHPDAIATRRRLDALGR